MGVAKSALCVTRNVNASVVKFASRNNSEPTLRGLDVSHNRRTHPGPRRASADTDSDVPFALFDNDNKHPRRTLGDK